MGLLELCEKYFQTKNLYEVLQISENATDKEVKKAYHRLSLKVHPDRVEENEKLEATEKFKVLGNIHAILTDSDKRAVYDETQSVDDDDYIDLKETDWSNYWKLLFKHITDEDIRAYEKEYIGSDLEKEDLKQAYLAGKGDMDYIVDHVQFVRTDQEARVRRTINTMIQNGELPEYKIFTHEPAKKRLRRIAKENREAKEAEEIAKLELEELSSGYDNLELIIKQKQESRAKEIDSFLDDLAAKYGGGKKPKANKRKAAARAESTSKNKKRK